MSGGKSYVLRWGAVAYSMYLFLTTGIRNIPVGLFSEDYPTLKDRQVSRIAREFPTWLGRLADTKEDGLGFFLAPQYGGGKILLRNLDDPAKYMSTEFAGEFVEELTRNPYQTFEDLRNRLRFPGITETKFMGATNPGGVGHGWVKSYFIEKDSGDEEQNRFFYVHATAFDNKYISREYIKQLETLPEAKKKAYLYGSWTEFAGQYFTEWKPHLHICPPFVPRKDLPIIGGLDWGRTHPFAMYLSVIQLKEYEGKQFYRVFTFYEAYGVEKTPRAWAEQIIPELWRRFGIQPQQIAWIQADTKIFDKGDDMSISIADQFSQAGLTRLVPASKDRIGGWENMHKWLSLAPDGLPYWVIAENCPNLIKTLPNLIHDPDNPEDVETSRKFRIDDDAGDATRYMLKRLKWIDGGKVGGIGKTGAKHFYPRGARMEEGKQLPINLDKFMEETSGKKKNGPYYPR